jgi:eukaryotic-like serine/threonine-protein kinase
VEAGPPSVAYRATKFIRRHRAGVTAAGVMVAALFIALAGAGWGYLSADAQRQRAQAEAEAAILARHEAEIVTSFLTEMLESATPEQARGSSPSTVTVREVLDRAAATIGSRLGNQPLVEARLRQTIGNAYRTLGVHGEAERQLQSALDIRRRQLGDHHADTLRVLGNIAGLRHEQGRFEEAVRVGEQALQAWRKAATEDDPTALGIMNNLAQTYSRMGRLAEAAALQRQVVEGQKRTQGPEHPHTLGGMVNLAQLLEDHDQFEESERLLLAATEGWTKAHGPDHPGTLLATSNLGALYTKLGRVAEAERLVRTAYEGRARVLGPSHPDTVRTLGNLGWTLLRARRMDEADDVLSTAWDAAASILGETHPDTQTIALNLLFLYDRQGWPESMQGRIIGLLRALRLVAAREDATPEQLNAAAWTLLTVRPESLRDPAAALRAATRCCELERERGGVELWQYLDTLAKAQFQTGSPGAAAENQREAIRLVPPVGERFRGEMEERLREYEAAAAAPGGGGP